MRDDQVSDEKLMKELDRMYLRIADIERPQSRAQTDSDDRGQDSGQVVKLHEKIIPFPKCTIPVASRKASEDELEYKRKPWYRSYLILPFPVIILLIVCLIISTKLIGPRNKEKTKTYQQTVSMPAQALAPAEREDFRQKIEEGERESEMRPDQTTKPLISLAQKSHYTVQVGAFENWEITSNLLEELRDKGLECRWVEIKTINGGSLYRVFSGAFDTSNEANEFMRKRGIVNEYPGSFIREISSNEAQSVLSPKANRED